MAHYLESRILLSTEQRANNQSKFHVELNSKGEVSGWFCGCGLYCDILTTWCKSCQYRRPFKLDDTVLATIKKRGLSDYWYNDMPMNEELKELHSKFFAEEKPLYKAMDFDTRRIHRSTLEQIAFEAKARLNAMDWIEREENEQLNPTQREWLRNSTKNPNPNLTDTITNIKERKKRVSKADKLLADMKFLGVEMADDLVANVEKRATKSKMDGITFRPAGGSKIILSELCRIEDHLTCVGSFRIGDDSHECKCSCHSPATPEVKIEDFNF